MIMGMKVRLYPNNKQKSKLFQSAGVARFAYKRFFKGKSKFPRFKSRKKSKPSFYVDTDKIKFTDDKVKLEKLTTNRKKTNFNWIKLAEKKRIPVGDYVKYSNPRVTYDGVNWYISVSVEVEIDELELNNESIGIDLGIKDLAIVSRKYQKNRKGERYVKTCNIIKLENKIRKLQKRPDNIRTDYRQKVTTKIVKTKPSRVVMESLNVSGMMKNKHLSKAIAQQGFYEFKKMIKYKCESCGIELDRDKNASINLSRYEVA